MDRETLLRELSTVFVSGVPVYKLDLVAMININGYHVFNVYRRYNNPLNIVLESTQILALFFVESYKTLKDTLREVYNRPFMNLNIAHFYSFYHGNYMPIYDDMEELTWDQLAGFYSAAVCNIMDNGEWVDDMQSDVAYVPQTPEPSSIMYVPNAPLRPFQEPLSALHLPSVSRNLANEFARAEKRTATSLSDEEDDYMELRSGTKIPKIFYD